MTAQAVAAITTYDQQRAKSSQPADELVDEEHQAINAILMKNGKAPF